MRKVELTEKQREVVRNRGGNLLVSAAAGAGKTEVLAEHILSKVVGEHADITRFLIITFTRDAAAQLRAKITNKLSAALAADPHNEHLQRQVHLVYAAQISTVHSFCSNLIRANASEVGLTPDFRLIDEVECRALRADVMNDVMEQAYADVTKTPDIASFLDLTVGRDDLTVQAIIHRVYDTIQSHPWPDKWMNECIYNMSVEGTTDAAETPWGRYIMDDIRRYAARQEGYVRATIDLCDSDTILSIAYGDALRDDLARIHTLSRATSWDSAFEFKTGKWMRLKAPKKGTDYDVSIQEQVKDMRDAYKAGFKSKLTAIPGSSAEALEDLCKTSSSVSGLFSLVRLFIKAYQNKKVSHGQMDYNDLEHYAIRLLVDEETGERTEIGDSISKQFDEVVVDEYQDTNDVQETIFAALSNGRNRFMVGDVKQSIYAFRQADPSIFLRHYTSYASYAEAGEGEPRKISLTHNFRSRAEILDATNAVMRACMSKEVGDIEYSDAEALVAGRTDFPQQDGPVVELTTLDMGGADSENDAEDDAASLAKVDVEARYVAERIHEMLESERIYDETTGEMRGVQPSDIAILLRAAKNTARHYVKALADLGIATKSTKNASLLDSEEISTLYCFLQVIDNPYQDIPLVGILASPLFGFSAEDLAQAKIANRSAVTFFEALQEYAGKSEKARRFLDILGELRNMVPYTRLTTLYNHIVDKCAARAVYGSMQDGTQREANIFAFGELISDFERKTARGLFQFLCHIESLREQEVEIPQPSVGAEADAVTVISTHTSKGLEYPIVFLADMSRQFNNSDTKNAVLMDRELGVGVQVYDIDLDYRYPTIARNAIAAKRAANARSEELRILYVGMTRAKQRLIMTYCSNMPKVLAKMAGTVENPLPPSVSQSVSCHGDWVLYTALSRPEGTAIYDSVGISPQIQFEASEFPWTIHCLSAADVGGIKRTMEELESFGEDVSCELPSEERLRCERDVDKIRADLNFCYDHVSSTRTPTVASPTSLNRTTPQIKVQFHEYGVEKKISPAQRGTAIHKFMQFANYHVCATGQSGVKKELARIEQDGFMSPEEAAAVSLPMLQHFFTSEVGRMLAAIPQENVRREFRFSLLLPANEVLPDTEVTEKVLLSGIIDLFVETDREVVLYDFKSDYVEDERAIEEKVISYATQLNVYAKALEEICHKPVVKKSLIFLRPAVEKII